MIAALVIGFALSGPPSSASATGQAPDQASAPAPPGRTGDAKRTEKLPNPPPPPPPPQKPRPGDEDVIRNLDLLEKLEFLDRLELFDESGDTKGSAVKR
jgi:hypothetical protein